jgi:hypothetical protein
MTGMETTATVSTDLDAVTDLVLKRQLIDVQRDHAKGIVKMVLECAAEAAGPVEPAYKPNYRRINVTIQDVSTVGYESSYNDNVRYITGWDGEPGHISSAYGPPRNDASPTAMTDTLRGLIGHNVALWITDDQFFAVPTILQFNDLGVSA